MRAILFCALPLALAACSQEPAPGQSADDFANRVGAGGNAVGSGASSVEGAPAPVATTAVNAPPPPYADVFAVEQLGNIGGVDLGPRAGGCTFSADGREMLIAAGPGDRSLPGKATVRVGGRLLLLDGPPGGFDVVRAGTVFQGEGFTVTIQPTGRDTGRMTITNAQRQQKALTGRWVCS